MHINFGILKMNNYKLFEFHKFADIFPMIHGVAFEELKKDIKEQGLQQAIVLYEDKILDGRNRFKACLELNIKPHFEEYKGNNPLNFVISLNLKRRHLNESQRGIIASKLATMTQGMRTDLELSANLRNVISQEDSAKLLNVSVRTIQSIKQIEREAPDKIREIEIGNKTANEIISEIKIKKRMEKISNQREELKKDNLNLPKGKYEIIVIDPPWEYGNVDNYNPDYYMNRVANPYPEMNIEQIKNLKIPASDNCVLWLWTTHKYIFECRNILNQWGFRDVSILTWVKTKMGIGKWLRSKSEYCVMAVKGNPIINLTNQTTVLIAENNAHSQKPQEFYNLVDELCIGRKLDYFSRQKRDGWDVFGDEVSDKTICKEE